MATAKQDNYLLVAAIDFGTTYSGYAFSTRNDFTRDPTKVYLKQWVDPTSTMISNKTSTCILFNKEKKFSKFGFEAEAKYVDLIIDEEYRDWYFFRRFKMSLYAIKSSDQNLVIEDETGKSMPALTVFSESIRYLKDSLLDECRKQHTSLKLDEIKWIVTVPAIWSDPAKALMRSAAITAGIHSEMLTIALEPEAAALFVKHLPTEKRVDGKGGESFQTFVPGSKYIVVDAGGGTIDITAHEVLDDGCVKELVKATGGNWGGVSVDESYVKFIKCLIGDKVTKKIERNQPSIFFEIYREFEIAKRTIKPDSDMKFTARIPSGLAETYASVNGRDLKTLKTVSMKSNYVVDVSFKMDKIRMASKDAEEFFADSVSKISEHLSKLFQHNSGREIATIILVGGYAESPVLINAIKAKFSHMRVIVPQEAAWSVLRGAVIFGHDPRLIKQRRSKFTYGIEISRIFDPTKHDEKYKFELDGEVRCYELFSKLVEIDELVSVGEYQKENRFHLREKGSKGDISLYSSTSNNPMYVDEVGCSFIGYVLSPGHQFLLNKAINIKMCFGETEIEISAYQPESQLTATYYLGQ